MLLLGLNGVLSLKSSKGFFWPYSPEKGSPLDWLRTPRESSLSLLSLLLDHLNLILSPDVEGPYELLLLGVLNGFWNSCCWTDCWSLPDCLLQAVDADSCRLLRSCLPGGGFCRFWCSSRAFQAPTWLDCCLLLLAESSSGEWSTMPFCSIHWFWSQNSSLLPSEDVPPILCRFASSDCKAGGPLNFNCISSCNWSSPFLVEASASLWPLSCLSSMLTGASLMEYTDLSWGRNLCFPWSLDASASLWSSGCLSLMLIGGSLMECTDRSWGRDLCFPWSPNAASLWSFDCHSSMLTGGCLMG